MSLKTLSEDIPKSTSANLRTAVGTLLPHPFLCTSALTCLRPFFRLPLASTQPIRKSLEFFRIHLFQAFAKALVSRGSAELKAGAERTEKQNLASMATWKLFFGGPPKAVSSHKRNGMGKGGHNVTR